MRRVVVRCVLALGVVAVCAQAWAGVPVQFEVVERFAAQLSAGRLVQVQGVLSSGVVLAEHELFVEVVTGPAVSARLRELINRGVRLEVAFESASAGGAVIVTREEMWLDDMPENLLPLRSTGVYVVDGGRVHGITRLLDTDQRDALMRQAIVGDWRCPGGLVFSLHADGTYDIVERGRPWDSGDYAIEGAVVKWVSDEQTEVCRTGDEGVWQMAYSSYERVTLDRIEEPCSARSVPILRLVRVTE
jgi:hypothetical protein